MSLVTNETEQSSDSSEKIEVLDLTVDVLIIIFSVFGNLLIILSVIRVKKLRKSFTNVLILNLAICDISLVVASIPPDWYNRLRGNYSFGELGCKLIQPIATYSVNAIAITLMLISFERFLVVMYSCRFQFLSNHKYLMITLTHLLALVTVIPIFVTSYLANDDGIKYCGETWNASSSRIYTVFLFLFQLAIPLIFMSIMYGIAWHVIKKCNSKTIKILNLNNFDNGSEEEEGPKETFAKRVIRHLSITATPRTLFQVKRARKTSEASAARSKQTIDTLKMFTGVLLVYAIFMMPNQITWFYLTFQPEPLSTVLEKVFYWMTYANAILNPWIYAGFNPSFRKAYKILAKQALELCCKGKRRSLRDLFLAENAKGDFALSITDYDPVYLTTNVNNNNYIMENDRYYPTNCQIDNSTADSDRTSFSEDYEDLGQSDFKRLENAQESNL